MSKVRVKVDYCDCKDRHLVREGQHIGAICFSEFGITEPGEYDIEVTPVRKKVRPIYVPERITPSGNIRKARYVCIECCRGYPLPSDHCMTCGIEFDLSMPAKLHTAVKKDAGLEVE